MNDEVLQALLESKREASVIANGFSSSVSKGMPDRDRLAKAMKAYILAKYRITEDDCASESMDDLSRASMDKLASSGSKAYEGDTASNCDGADSAAVKHAFLMMAIQKDFGVTLDAFAAGRAKTVSDIVDMVFEQLADASEKRSTS